MERAGHRRWRLQAPEHRAWQVLPQQRVLQASVLLPPPVLAQRPVLPVQPVQRMARPSLGLARALEWV